jgi:hypothetical protein
MVDRVRPFCEQSTRHLALCVREDAPAGLVQLFKTTVSALASDALTVRMSRLQPTHCVTSVSHRQRGKSILAMQKTSVFTLLFACSDKTPVDLMEFGLV